MSKSHCNLPVFNLASLNPASRSDLDKPMDGFSPMRPAGQTLSPTSTLHSEYFFSPFSLSISHYQDGFPRPGKSRS